MKKRGKILYIVCFLILCLSPSAGLLIGGHQTSRENRTASGFPEIFHENRSLNKDFLNQAGQYFEENFAWRNNLVTSYDLILAKIFRISGQDGVIVGDKGWLFYKDSLDDYQGNNLMTDRQLFDVAHSLAMIQEYAGEYGVDFAFAIAPNKNELYPDYMPYYYRYFRGKENNLSRILPWLKEEGVKYADLYQMFCNSDEVYYHKRDSHWNNRGAMLAAGEILDFLGKEHADYENRASTMRKDFDGDLSNMLYPSLHLPEREIYYDPGPDYSYVEEVENNFVPKINTLGQEGSGRLVMYRDSFTNALLPFMAEAFEEAYFSRGIPYQLTDIENHEADTLVIERAERFLPEMAENPPLLPDRYVTEVDLLTELTPVKTWNIKEEDMDEYSQVQGIVDKENLDTRARIIVLVNKDLYYEAVPGTDGEGNETFTLYLSNESLEEKDNTYEVYVHR